jgi:hypothetical protein
LNIRLGEWNDAKEEAYKLILEDRSLTLEEQRVVDDLFMQPLKFGYFGPHLSPGTARPILLKMSLATLTPNLVKGTQLQSLYNTMMSETNPIDMVAFDTAVKVGTSDKTEYYSTDENGVPNTDLVNSADLPNMQKTTASFQYLRRQTITDPHNELRDVVKTQFRKVALSNSVNDRLYHIADESDLDAILELQGNNGGGVTSSSYGGGGGGGGAGGVGQNGTGNGTGGAATSAYSVWASATSTGVGGSYAGGGGAGGYSLGGYSAPGGGGGAGAGGGDDRSGADASANTGSGGGGGGQTVGPTAGSGGSGLVIIRYLT